MRASCLLAFFGFLRCGEFTVSKERTFDPTCHLCYVDVNIRSDHIAVNIKVSKTDPFRKGYVVKLFRTGNKLCPYTGLLHFKNVRHVLGAAPLEPFFLLPDNTPLSRARFLAMVNALCQTAGLPTIHGHSFRIGAATTAAASLVPDHLIKTLGRWQSDCYQRYIRTPDSILQKALRAMSEAAAHQPC